MDGAIEYYSKSEVCTVVRFLQAEGMSQSEINRRLVTVYGQKVFSQKELSIEADPRTSHTDENCVIVEGLIREDRRVKSS
jgi:hypothetical protein